MAALGFLNAPTKEARKALPTDLDPPRPEVLSKTVFIFHDETTFQANDDQPTFWASKGMHKCHETEIKGKQNNGV